MSENQLFDFTFPFTNTSALDFKTKKYKSMETMNIVHDCNGKVFKNI